MDTRMYGIPVAVAVLLLTGACGGGDDGGSPATGATAEAGDKPVKPSGGNMATEAPPVPNPVDATTLVETPCAALTAAQRSQFGFGSGTPGKGDGMTCTYDRPGGTPVTVAVAYKDTTGLELRYYQHWKGKWPYWEPTTVDGHPAVAFDDDKPDRSCTFAIAADDSEHFWAIADDASGEPRCATAKKVASAVLATVKAGI